MLDLFVGIDHGGSETKAALWEADRCLATGRGAAAPALRELEPARWPQAIRTWADQLGYPVGSWRGLGLSLALPIVRGMILDPTRKFRDLDGLALEELRSALSRGLALPVSIIHDGQAALLGELALAPAGVPGRSGMLTFGKSIGFGWAVDGHIWSGPYTSWVSHLQLCPDGLPGAEPCVGCGQLGCWRVVYQTLKGTDDAHPNADCLDTLLRYTAQGIAGMLNVLPLDRLFLGGGWVAHNLDPRGIRNEAVRRREPYAILMSYLKGRMLIDPASVLQLGKSETYSAAIGAAWHASREAR